MDAVKKKAYDKVYQEANKEKIKAQSKAWYEANKERIRAQQKAYYQANKEQRITQIKIWQKVNSEKITARKKVYRKANLENRREASRNRRALKYQTQVEAINEKMVYFRDGWKCQICHKRVNKNLKYPNPMSASLDHIMPLNQGGTHTYKNVQLAHLLCNLSKNMYVLPHGEQLRIF